VLATGYGLQLDNFSSWELGLLTYTTCKKKDIKDINVISKLRRLYAKKHQRYNFLTFFSDYSYGSYKI